MLQCNIVLDSQKNLCKIELMLQRSK